MATFFYSILATIYELAQNNFCKLIDEAQTLPSIHEALITSGKTIGLMIHTAIFYLIHLYFIPYI